MIGGVHDPAEKAADSLADRVMRMPEPAAVVRRACAECAAEDKARRQVNDEEEETVRMRAGAAMVAPGAASAPAPAAAKAALGAMGAGRPLSRAERTFFEPRFCADFSAVRVHDDGAAARAARALHARAFTLGHDIAFAPGERAPGAPAPDRLMAHELAHLVQQAPGVAAPRGGVPLAARAIAVRRQPAPAKADMTRDDLAKKLKVIFGHDIRIEVGDKERQTRELGGRPEIRKLPDDWKKWDPGASSPLYDQILGAVEDFGREVGGVPDIGQIVFYDVHYDYDEQLKVVADRKVAAKINRSKGIMFVYRAALFETEVAAGGREFTRSGIFLPSGRSTAGKKGTSAPLGPATQAESQRRAVAHELAHGLERATRSLDEFEQTVGWVRVGGEKRLYDIQVKGVKTAIAKGTEPPAAARITKSDWNSGSHLEQPMTEYAVTDSTEDYAESLMAWLYARDVLKARSPARFKFFDDQARRKGWLPKLVTGGAPAAPTQKTP